MNISLPDFLIMCGSLLLIALLILEIVDWTKLLAPLTNNHPTQIPRDNSTHKDEARTIIFHEQVVNEYCMNIITHDAVVMELSKPLNWHGYSSHPMSMTMKNNKNTIVIYGVWPEDSVPVIKGGPLMNSHKFHSISFHWGENDNVGCGHTIDNVKYPLQIQLIHINKDIDSLNSYFISKNNNNKYNDNNNISIVTYLFKIRDNDNSQLEPIVRSLCRVVEPESQVYIKPFQLDSLFSTFENKFYSYCGNLIQPLFNESVTWIVNPESMNISARQMKEFRKIYSHTLQQTQDTQNLDIYYYE
ncbi:hypothetical protein HCN44_006663 [Aphidius gifuensis]|uniref:Alpha-carbonic anhydrase domain-containing protein n=1 Tax=Aphidius gifuensis TaxID=684658 RepID=A0A834Y081_APHGI|nr:carbonic anhydrase 1-like [Aphidius gifuensis]KAF7995556.1 hypothetical protein HCN44_006663 [Aphidius gifuensis]